MIKAVRTAFGLGAIALLSGCDLMKVENTDPVRELTGCLSLVQGGEIASVPIEDRQQAVAEACVKPLKKRQCADVFDEPRPGLSAFERCRDAYCPELGSASLAACEQDGDVSDATVRTLFFIAVLSRDFDVELPAELTSRLWGEMEELSAGERQQAFADFLVETRQDESLSREQRAVLGTAAILGAMVFAPGM